jgi:hypothetical protein
MAPAQLLDPEQLSPELILVSPPELAEVARALLPDPEPFDEWLRRVRAAEPQPIEPEAGDWEYDAPRGRWLGGALFAAVCVANAVLPVLLFILGH